MKTILIVDDEPRTRQGIRKTLEAWSCGRHRIEMASSGVEALAWLQQNEAHLLVTDIRMPEVGGLELVERLSAMTLPLWLLLFPGILNSIMLRKHFSLGSSHIC